MAYRTLGALRAELLARLGMAGLGASGGANSALIDSFLRNGQAQLYWMQDWKRLQAYTEKTTGVGQNQYDYPDDCSRDRRILRIETFINGLYVKLKEGISTQMWSTMEIRSQPARYERLDQILIYPKANSSYTLRFWYVKDLLPFTQTDDVATLDDEMILLHALANAKAHYRQPDATVYQGQLNALLGSLRAQTFSANGVYRRDEEFVTQPRPVVVGRDQ